jgi:hypothetical protein
MENGDRAKEYEEQIEKFLEEFISIIYKEIII